MELATGTRINQKYTIVKWVGSGGMATVYQATHGRSGTTVALKLLQAVYKQDSDILKRFQREFEIISALKHPNIVRVLDSGQFQGSPYFVMEYMAGGSLAERFNSPVEMRLETTGRLLEQVARGLDHAHDQQIVHRDIKLGNILLDEQGRVAVSDFGIARMATHTTMTTVGTRMGTPAYMSPEQLQGQEVDHRTDLYSLAVVAYLLLTGQFPFGGSPQALWMQIVNKAPDPVTELNPLLPKSLDDVLIKGMAKDPDQRYQRAQDFVSDFQQAIGTATQIKTMIRTQLDNDFFAGTPASLGRINSKPAEPSSLLTQQTPESHSRGGGGRITMSLVLALALIVIGIGLILTQLDIFPSATPPTNLEPDVAMASTQLPQLGTTTTTPTLASSIQTPTATLTPSSTGTATLTPSSTATATLTPSSTATATLRVEIITETPVPTVLLGTIQDGLNVRSGPGLSFSTIAAVREGTRHVIQQTSEDGNWYRIAINNTFGWVSAEFVNVQEIAATEVDTDPSGDNDGDGIANSFDVCPFVFGTVPDGCPDQTQRDYP